VDRNAWPNVCATVCSASKLLSNVATGSTPMRSTPRSGNPGWTQIESSGLAFLVAARPIDAARPIEAASNATAAQVTNNLFR